MSLSWPLIPVFTLGVVKMRESVPRTSMGIRGSHPESASIKLPQPLGWLIEISMVYKHVKEKKKKTPSLGIAPRLVT